MVLKKAVQALITSTPFRNGPPLKQLGTHSGKLLYKRRDPSSRCDLGVGRGWDGGGGWGPWKGRFQEGGNICILMAEGQYLYSLLKTIYSNNYAPVLKKFNELPMSRGRGSGTSDFGTYFWKMDFGIAVVMRTLYFTSRS